MTLCYFASGPGGSADGADTYAYVGSSSLLLVDPRRRQNHWAERTIWQSLGKPSKCFGGKQIWNSNVVSQVLVRPLDESGNPVNYRVRLDNAITQPGQPLRLLDAKGSAKAEFTENQRQGYPLIGKHGGVIESGPQKGMRIPKSEVQTIRPGGLGDI